MVVTTIRPPRCRARMDRASWWLIAMTLLREQNDTGSLLRPRLPVGSGEIVRRRSAVQETVRKLPRLQQGLGEDWTAIGRGALLVGVITAHANHQEQRQLQVVDDVAQGIAGLEEAGTLDHH